LTCHPSPAKRKQCVTSFLLGRFQKNPQVPESSHEFVTQSVLDAIMRVQMSTNTPVIYGILTPQDFLSDGREEFFFQHCTVKGKEAAVACAKTIRNLALVAAA